jgi:hypothetical protein
MRWAGHVARMGEERKVYKVFVGKPECHNPRYITGMKLSYEEEKDIHSKITIFLQILRLLKITLKPNLVNRKKILTSYKTLAVPTSFIW